MIIQEIVIYTVADSWPRSFTTASIPARGAGLLDRWAGYGSVGAKHTTVALQCFQQGATVLALIVKLTVIRGHGFAGRLATLRAGQFRDQFNAFHQVYCSPERVTSLLLTWP